MKEIDQDFVKTLCSRALEKGFKPPFVFTQKGMQTCVQRFYEYGTEISVENKIRFLVEDGLFEVKGFDFVITPAGLKIGGLLA
jgi:hypothetical protein